MDSQEDKINDTPRDRVNDYPGGQKQKSPSVFLELLKVVFWALIIILPIRVFLFQPFFVQGASMEPNFFDGEYLIVNELGYKQTEVNIGGKELFVVRPYKDLMRGDVIVFRYPKNPSQYFIKRVIGLPGEKVEIRNNLVIISNEENPDGLVLNESGYISSTTATNGNEAVALEKNDYFVLGDNRQHSSDSRAWGPVSQDHIIGKVLLRAWPVDRLDLFKR